MTWAHSPGPTRQKERTSFSKLPADLCTHGVASTLAINEENVIKIKTNPYRQIAQASFLLLPHAVGLGKPQVRADKIRVQDTAPQVQSTIREKDGQRGLGWGQEVNREECEAWCPHGWWKCTRWALVDSSEPPCTPSGTRAHNRQEATVRTRQCCRDTEWDTTNPAWRGSGKTS